VHCYYHLDREVAGSCVNCGKGVCVECKTVLDEKIYCSPCGNALFTASIQKSQELEIPGYSKGLRITSGILGVLLLLGSISGISYYVEFGSLSELVVDLIHFAIAIVFFTLAFSPGWVTDKLRIKLHNGAIFGAVTVALITVAFIALLFAPVPPESWLSY